jgi:hypothetical protein
MEPHLVLVAMLPIQSLITAKLGNRDNRGRVGACARPSGVGRSAS